MGFKKEPTVYKLVFEAYDGFEVTVKSMSVAELLELTNLAATVEADSGKNIENAKELFKSFANCLVSWNLEDKNGTPVPADIKGVNSQEFGFIIEIIVEWMNAVSAVSPNLEQKLSTTPSLEQLPMETL